MGNFGLKRYVAAACALALVAQAPFSAMQVSASGPQEADAASKIAKKIEEKLRETKSLDLAKDLVLSEEFAAIWSISFADQLKKAGVSVKELPKATEVLRKSVAKDASSSVRVYVRSAESETALKDAFSIFGETSVKKFSPNTYEIQFPKVSRIWKAIEKRLASGNLPTSLPAGVEIIAPSYLKTTVSTGTYLAWENLANMWGQKKISATDYQYGLSEQAKVRVGIIDTGVMATHADLSANMWKNPKEIAGNGLDDDGNGYADDVHGYNFVSNNGNASDDHGHGTHVAGIVWSAVNWAGSFGANSNASLVALKVLDASGAGSSYDIAEAINYAANNGIPVINLSLWGNGNPANDMMCNAIASARTKWTLSVVAAGNENADVSGKVPAGCPSALTVWAVDSNLAKASFSNYGAEVDVSAPGVSIYSTYTNGGYVLMSGTSMATPFVAGLAAAIKAHKPAFAPSDVAATIKNDATTVPVTSSVNVGRFVKMDLEMNAIAVANDVNWGSTEPQNQAPTVSANAVSVWTNSYRIDTTAADADGTVVKYEYWNGSALLASGPALSSHSLTVTQNTTVTVRVYDDKWASASTQVSLAYVAPVVNALPSLTLNVKKSTTYSRLNITSSDSDGVVAKIELYVNGILSSTVTPNTQKYSGYVDFAKGKSYSVKVVSFDNKWASTSKSVNIK